MSNEKLIQDSSTREVEGKLDTRLKVLEKKMDEVYELFMDLKENLIKRFEKDLVKEEKEEVRIAEVEKRMKSIVDDSEKNMLDS